MLTRIGVHAVARAERAWNRPNPDRTRRLLICFGMSSFAPPIRRLAGRCRETAGEPQAVGRWSPHRRCLTCGVVAASALPPRLGEPGEFSMWRLIGATPLWDEHLVRPGSARAARRRELGSG